MLILIADVGVCSSSTIVFAGLLCVESFWILAGKDRIVVAGTAGKLWRERVMWCTDRPPTADATIFI
jgi:hypothetical protein